MNPKLCLVALPVVLPIVFTCLASLSSVATPTLGGGETLPDMHPHFPKVLQCQISRELTMTVRYQTVTFDAEGAKKMKPGQSWHLAGASIETTKDLLIGGKKISAGKYALSVQKAKDEKWVLTLHEGRGFSRPGDDAHVLETRFQNDAPLFEHMNIDVQPAGDKTHTRLHLDVRFDKLLASATIEVPEKDK